MCHQVILKQKRHLGIDFAEIHQSVMTDQDRVKIPDSWNQARQGGLRPETCHTSLKVENLSDVCHEYSDSSAAALSLHLIRLELSDFD